MSTFTLASLKKTVYPFIKISRPSRKIGSTLFVWRVYPIFLQVRRGNIAGFSEKRFRLDKYQILKIMRIAHQTKYSMR